MLTAIALALAVRRLDYVVTLLIVAIFLALTLNPLVEMLMRRGLRRSGAVSVVFLWLLVAITGIGALVIPPIVDESTALMYDAPTYTQQLLEHEWIQQADRDFQLTDRFQNELQKRVASGELASQVTGGVLGAGRVVATGAFGAFTVLVLTLYLLATLPQVKRAGYALVPASRRTRVQDLSERIMARVGGYAAGQFLVATINAACSWVMMTVLGIPYAAVLAVLVGFLGLIPLVGATIGAVVVGLIALSVSVKTAIIVLVYYGIYQQIENYVIVPNIMKRTVSVPGAVTVVAALIGGTLLGILGALLAIPTAAGLLLLYEEVLVPRQEKR
ncbi:Predicted PurR-regulated permease PerM [Kytococcus aerolatus]|uniref:Predicted PurR-regulated permease PerM n=1 Tax=Kytococcus aerolatus TaxID=592308 RepID=A0A212U0G5_9MICO|nr:AI-2E family transporter [Kytococcus aerolatus]SNC71743.1 Predicted PurR-regulated permease PerM [Kytococcus aerolatus]